MLVFIQEIWRETNKGRQIVSLFFQLNYRTKIYYTMTIILTISTIIITCLFFVACYRVNQLEELLDAYRESYNLNKEQKDLKQKNMQEQLKRYMIAVDAIKGGN